jgi:hypothetical protein
VSIVLVSLGIFVGVFVGAVIIAYLMMGAIWLLDRLPGFRGVP